MNGQRWHKRQIDFVRTHYGKLPVQWIANVVRRTPLAVKSYATAHGLASRHRLRPDQEAYIREHYGKRPAAEIAAELGKAVRTIWNAARRLGVAKKGNKITPAGKRTLCRMARQGYCNRCIGRAINLGRKEVRRWRGTLGVPQLRTGGAVDSCRTCKERTREGARRQLETAGLANLAEVRSEAYRRYAVENGWPANLRPREVQILNVLATRGIPMTRLELAAAIGMRTDRMGGNGTLALLASCNGPGGTYTASLMRQGLLAAIKRGAHVTGRGKGRSRDLYYLGQRALQILEERARCVPTAKISL